MKSGSSTSDLGIGQDEVVVIAHEAEGVQPDLKLLGRETQTVAEDPVDHCRWPHEEAPFGATPGHMTRFTGKKVSW